MSDLLVLINSVRVAQMVFPRSRILEDFATTLHLTDHLIMSAMYIIHVALEIHHTLSTFLTPVISA